MQKQKNKKLAIAKEIATSKEISTAYLKNARSSPKKLHLAARLVARMPVLQAQSQLTHQPQKSCDILLDLLKSAIANATQKDKEVNLEKVFINIIDIGPGLTKKKGNPRARGRYDVIIKKFSNIRISLNLKLEEKNGK